MHFLLQFQYKTISCHRNIQHADKIAGADRQFCPCKLIVKVFLYGMTHFPLIPLLRGFILFTV